MVDVFELIQAREAICGGTARAVRERARLTQSEVAEALGVHWTTVARWEAGTRVPRGAVALQYLRLLRQLEAVAG